MRYELTVNYGLSSPCTIMYTSDVHTNKMHLPEFLSEAETIKPDIIIINGDLVPKFLFYEHKNLNVVLRKQEAYLRNELLPMLQAFKKILPNTKIFIDLGNDDFKFNRFILTRQEGIYYNLLHMNVFDVLPELQIAGYMCVPITPFGIKDWEKPDKRGAYPSDGRLSGVISVNGAIQDYTINVNTENTIENDLKILREKITKPFIFISHSPPRNTNLDMIGHSVGVGSIAIRSFIDAEDSMIASLHGHIHESPEVSGYISQSLGDTLCINIGQKAIDLKYLVLTVK